MNLLPPFYEFKKFMRITLVILTFNLFLIGCATNTPIEDNYMGSKTNFEDIVLIKGANMATAKALVLESLDSNAFQITLNDNRQNVFVAKKKVDRADAFITTSIYLFKTSDGINVRVVSNLPKNHAKIYSLHSDLLDALNKN